MSDKPQIEIPEDAEFVQFGDLLKELPQAVADVLLAAHDPLLADMDRPRVIRHWRTALKQAAEAGELKGSMLSATALSGWMMSEEVNLDSIRSFLEARGFEVVVRRPDGTDPIGSTPEAGGFEVVVSPPDGPGEAQSRIVQIRRDDLSAVTNMARARAADPSDTSSVWQALMSLAQDKVPPLIGFSDGEVKYTSSDGDIKALSKDALRKRLRRAKDGR
jgi:hypothetical protein